MGVGADGYDLTAKLTVALQNIFGGVGMPQTVPEAAGIDLNSFSAGDQQFQTFIDYITVFPVGVIPVFVGAVANYIVDMAVYIEFVKGPDVFRDREKIFQIGILLVPALIVSGKIGIRAVYHMEEPMTKSKS